MIIRIYSKCCIFLLVGFPVMIFCAACEMETFASEAALEFAYKWVANPKMYVGLILPNKCPFRTSNIVRLIKIVNPGFLDAE